MMTDPIADMLTRIRNANSIERPAAEMKATKLKANIAQVLKDEGFILDYQVGKYDGTEFKAGAQAGRRRQCPARLSQIRPGRRKGHSLHPPVEPARPPVLPGGQGAEEGARRPRHRRPEHVQGRDERPPGAQGGRRRGSVMCGLVIDW